MAKETSESVTRELAQQIGQEIGEALSQSISQLLQKATQTTATTEIRQEEVAAGEILRSDNVRDAGMRGLNVKSHFDQHIQNLNLQTNQALQYLTNLQNESLKHLSELHGDRRKAANSSYVLNDLAVAQAIDHRGSAHDASWNPDPGEDTSEKEVGE